MSKVMVNENVNRTVPFEGQPIRQKIDRLVDTCKMIIGSLRRNGSVNASIHMAGSNHGSLLNPYSYRASIEAERETETRKTRFLMLAR